MSPKDVEGFLAERKAEGLRIDPLTAKVSFSWVVILDPYGIRDDLPEEAQCIGRCYFAADPVREVWVEFADLPLEKIAAIEQEYERNPKKYDMDLDFLFADAE